MQTNLVPTPAGLVPQRSVRDLDEGKDCETPPQRQVCDLREERERGKKSKFNSMTKKGGYPTFLSCISISNLQVDTNVSRAVLSICVH